ncbi:MAG: molybdopterin-dependent oxidoreductase, partial [Syntrophobacteraceae bacterium]|nr:molybdopterin-dependent oxidoreductase [Syntrophobacteraceae bacterium]
MTNSFADFAKAKMIIAIGTNMTEAHPVAATYVKNAVADGAELIVVDPRRTGLADFASIHVPIKVGSDIAFLNGIMNVLIAEDLYAKDYVASCTIGFDELKAKVEEYPPERAAEICGISADLIREVARRLASVKPALLAYTLGITEHTCGMNNVLSCANLQMLLGNVGFEGGGVNPIRGQNNVQGACDMGALPNVFPGYQRVDDPAFRKKFQTAWDVESLPDKPGMMMPSMLEGLLDGKIKAFITVCAEQALEAARSAEAEISAGRYRGPLHGIPISLKDLIGNNGGLAVHRAVNLMRQVLDGIAYAHEQGIIHRDLSPSNVL